MNKAVTPPAWQAISIEAEQALLGAILLKNEVYSLVSGMVSDEDFGEPVHGYLFRVMADLISAGKLADYKLVMSLVENVELIPGVGMRKYLAKLAAESITLVNARDYARHIRELSDRRKIAAVGQNLAPRQDIDAASMAAEAIDALDQVVSHKSSQGRVSTIAQAAAAAVDAAAHAYARDGKLLGIPYGCDLDIKTGGMAPGDLIVLAGRPGMGKSAMLLTILRKAAEAGYSSLFFSLEMSEEQLAQRMISDVIFDTGEALPYFNIRSGNFHERLFTKVRDAAIRIGELPILIDDRAGQSISQIAARARQIKRKQGLHLLAIDHLDLIKASNRYAGNRVYELAEVTSTCKELAKELEIPVILLSQLNRVVEQRENKKPLLSDLRSSGSIEQDADTVIFLYREAYYLQNAEPRPESPEHLEWQRKCEVAHNKLEVIIAKQRMGPSGTIELFCDIGSNAVRNLRNDALPDRL